MRAIEIDAVIDDRHEIHVTLPLNVQKGAVRVIVLYDDPLETPLAVPREFGQYRGQIHMPDDFDAPLPDLFWTGSESS